MRKREGKNVRECDQSRKVSFISLTHCHSKLVCYQCKHLYSSPIFETARVELKLLQEGGLILGMSYPQILDLDDNVCRYQAKTGYSVMLKSQSKMFYRSGNNVMKLFTSVIYLCL